MDLEYFLKNRLDFAIHFYETASAPFSNTIKAIELGAEPFAPYYDESGEPPYLEEWERAKTGLESVGITSLSMVASAVQLFLNEWVSRLDRHSVEKYKRTHKKRGWLHAYRLILEQFGLVIENSGVDWGLIEQCVLVRNAGQHPDCLTMLNVRHSESDLEKHASPFFVTKNDREVLLQAIETDSWWLNPIIYVDMEKLNTLVEEVNRLGIWLEKEYWDLRCKK